MTQTHKPALPLPEPLRGAETGTFAHNTVAVRIKQIARRMLAENNFPADIVERVETLLDEIPQDRVRPLNDPLSPDLALWDEYLAAVSEMTWLETPWFFAETYFYRRVLEAIRYFQPGDGYLFDPYLEQKQMGLETSRAAIQALAERVSRYLAAPSGNEAHALSSLIKIDLWGNQADLSLWPVGSEDQPLHEHPSQKEERILADHTPAVIALLTRSDTPLQRVDILMDNAGFELVCDLALVDYLLSRGLAKTAFLNLKAHPTFVSDAMIKDIQPCLTFLAAEPSPETQAMANRLKQHLHTGRLVLQDDFFWNSPLPCWEMPDRLYRELGGSDLLISKGDANYRRLLGDVHWPFTTPFADITAYFPTALLALRTSKSEIMCGLKTGQADELPGKDPNWLTGGKWGVIQFKEG